MADLPPLNVPMLPTATDNEQEREQEQQAISNGLAMHTTDTVMADSNLGTINEPLSTPIVPIATHQQQHQQQQPLQPLQPQPSLSSAQPPSYPVTQPTATQVVAAPPAIVSSSRNSPHPTQQAPMQPIPHGSPTRIYLNQHITPYLLEAMKHLATTEPDKPLKWLSEFLANKSAEIEGP